MRKNLLVFIVVLASWTMYAGAENTFIDNRMSVTSGSKGSGVYHPNQMNQPFQAFGGLSLSGGDYIYTKNGVPQKIGQVEYTYDANGKAIRSEWTVKIVDSGLQKVSEWGEKVPVNAIYKCSEINTDDLREDECYYLDPSTGERVDLSYYKRAYFNGYKVSEINRYWDDNDNWVEKVEAESVFDSEGRPLSTIRYSYNYLTDSVTGKQKEVLAPYRKVEYEYTQDNLVTTTDYYLRKDKNGNEYWIADSRETDGTDNNGLYYYEYMSYSESDSAWYGNEKYSSQSEEYNGGEKTTETYWSWNNSLKDWTLSEKKVSIYNSADNFVCGEDYGYDTLLCSFYLRYMSGHDYLGDTLQCSDWHVDFRRPDSLNQFTYYPMSLVNDASKTEYAYYTFEELGLPATAGEYLSLPKKYEITDFLYNIGRDGAIEWRKNIKKEYDYTVMTITGKDSPRILLSASRNSYYGRDSWSLAEEWRYEYNDHGDEVVREMYNNNIIMQREVKGYEYRVRYYSWGDSAVERKTINEEYWSRNNEGHFVCTTTKEFEYDSQGRTIYDANRSNWDETLDTWSYGSLYESEYDENGRTIMSASYDWDSENKEWAGYNKSINMYDERGRDTLSEYYSWNLTNRVWVGSSKNVNYYDESGSSYYNAYYYGRLDENNNTVWIPGSLSRTERDSAGHTVLSEEYYTWNTSAGTWSEGSKKVYTYSESGLQTGFERTGMAEGIWYNLEKEDFEYDVAGNMTLDIRYNYSGMMGWYIFQKSEYKYTQSGELMEYYSYCYEDGQLLPQSKRIAKISGGRIVEYADSSYVLYDYDEDWNALWRWEQSASTLISYDDATGTTTETLREWDSYNNQWQDYSMNIKRLDSDGRIIYFESYSKQYVSYYDGNYYVDSLVWIGDEKYEHEYDAFGNVIMNAYYYWEGSEWVGNYKEEKAYDPVTGDFTLSASYNWDYERKDWRGSYDKREQEFDSQGYMVMSAEYYWDDNVWGWVGSNKREYEYDASYSRSTVISYEPDAFGGWVYSSKRIYSTVDGVACGEEYVWDSGKQDWRGNYKSEYLYVDSIDFSMSAHYYWDEDEWCWVGDRKYENRYWDDGYERAEYDWDMSGKCWVGTYKKNVQEEESLSSSKKTIISSLWNKNASKWELDYRETDLTEYRSDQNIERELMTIERPQGSSWILDCTLEMTFDYSVWDGVDDIVADFADNFDISVFDGGIRVESADDAVIRIFSESGNNVATGTGSVTASVAPGIYYISVNAKTIKILVR